MSVSSTAVAQIYQKVVWRIIPLLLICYVFAYLDRVNVGFAKLKMMTDLGFSSTVYGLGAGIFFIGYFLFEIPSNILLHRVGARRWIARIMFTWGLLSAANAFVATEWQFYLLRFLLGVAEAGFFPGVLLYLTYWFPASRSSRSTALFMTAVPLTGVIGGPISGWILERTDGLQGLAGWQWLFMMEALPAILASAAVLVLLSDRIRDASWLTPSEKTLLEETIRAEQHEKASTSVIEVFRRADIWLLCAIYFSLVVGLYGISFWLPTLIRATGVSHPFEIGLWSALPYAVAAGVMIPVSLRSDRLLERRWHVALPSLIGGVGFFLSLLMPNTTFWAVLSMTLATTGIITALPVFWSLPSARLGGVAAAAGLAFINSVGNLGGFAGPSLIGLLAETALGTRAGVLFLGLSMTLAAALTLRLREVDSAQAQR
jgi:MFS family permease